MDQVRNVSCRAIPEEPTEYSCSFEELCEGSDWQLKETVIAIDGHAWISLDRNPTCLPTFDNL